MPNWRRIRALRDGLAKTENTEYRKFSMGDYIRIISGNRSSITAAKLRRNGPECGAAACIAGEAIIRFHKSKVPLPIYDTCVDPAYVHKTAQKLLGLTSKEAEYMFSGRWLPSRRLADITRKQAISYLTATLREKIVF